MVLLGWSEYFFKMLRGIGTRISDQTWEPVNTTGNGTFTYPKKFSSVKELIWDIINPVVPDEEEDVHPQPYQLHKQKWLCQVFKCQQANFTASWSQTRVRTSPWTALSKGGYKAGWNQLGTSSFLPRCLCTLVVTFPLCLVPCDCSTTWPLCCYYPSLLVSFSSFQVDR